MTSEDLESKIEQTPQFVKPTKIKEWAWRYGPSEVTGLIAAYTGFFITRAFTDNPVVCAYACATSESVCYYGTIFAREFIKDIKIARAKKENFSLSNAVKTTGKLFSEFGIAEPIDILFMRAAAMGFCSRKFGEGIGIAAGKFIADLVFYAIAITSYESRKYFSAKRNINTS